MHSYLNPFYIKKVQESKEILSCEKDPIIYKSFLIFERVEKLCFDVVKDGKCIGMYAGINGAKKFIDGEYKNDFKGAI